MDARSAELLEFGHIQERLAAYAAFPPSRALAGTVTPSSKPIVVERRLDETDEARWLLTERPEVGIGGARDIGPIIVRAGRGGRGAAACARGRRDRRDRSRLLSEPRCSSHRTSTDHQLPNLLDSSRIFLG